MNTSCFLLYIPPVCVFFKIKKKMESFILSSEAFTLCVCKRRLYETNILSSMRLWALNFLELNMDGKSWKIALVRKHWGNATNALGAERVKRTVYHLGYTCQHLCFDSQTSLFVMVVLHPTALYVLNKMLAYDHFLIISSSDLICML